MDDVKPLVMVGAGPSALAAAVYTTREDIDTTLYEKGVVGASLPSPIWLIITLASPMASRA